MTRMVDIALKHTRTDSERRDAILSGKYTDRWGRSEVLIDTVPCFVPTYVYMIKTTFSSSEFIYF